MASGPDQQEEQEQKQAEAGDNVQKSESGCHETLRQKAFRFSQNHRQPLTVLGILGRVPHALTARNLLDQLCVYEVSHKEASDLLDLQLGEQISCIYQERDNILYICLEVAGCDTAGPWAAQTEAGNALDDADFLASCGHAELKQLMDWLVLTSICHGLIVLCPGASPRVDFEALRLLNKVQEIQDALQLQPLVVERPLAMFLHAELRLPLSKEKSHQLLEGSEKALDNKWRTCLVKLKILQDHRRSGLIRIPRPCVAAHSGRLASFPEMVSSVILDETDPCAMPDPPAILSPVGSTRHLCMRVADMLDSVRAESSKREHKHLEAWLDAAKALHQQVKCQLGPACVIPPELDGAIHGSVDQGFGPPERPRRIKDSSQKAKDDLVQSLCHWAHADLIFSLGSGQLAVEEACKAYGSGMQKISSPCPQEAHEQELRAGEQLAKQKAYAPLHEAALAAARKHCTEWFGSRQVCQSRSLTGRGCLLLAGHKEEHRSGFRTSKVCLCGKSQVNRHDCFTVPETTASGLPPSGSCCHNVSFLPFLPLTCDFVQGPVLIPAAPQMGKVKSSKDMPTSLPSALPPASGFVALVADPPVKVDPKEGSRLPGFGDTFHEMSRWRLPPVSDPLGALGLNPAGLSSGGCVYVGFEYMCPQGQRFFAPPQKHSGLVIAEASSKSVQRRRDKRAGSSAPTGGGGSAEIGPGAPGLLDEGAYEVAPLCPYRLYVPCVRHHRRDRHERNGNKGHHHNRERDGQSARCVAQLTRIWVQTPPIGKNGEIIEAAPRVSLVDIKAGKRVDGRYPEVTVSGGRVALPPESLVQLVLPTTYLRPEAEGEASSPLPGFWELATSDAERCRLLPYLLWVSKPS